MVDRFGGMRSWESSDHPIVQFNVDPRTLDVGGVDLISLDASLVDRYLKANLRMWCQGQGMDFGRDWSKITNEDGVRRLRAVEGLTDHSPGGLRCMDEGYVLTIDNLLKMFRWISFLKFLLCSRFVLHMRLRFFFLRSVQLRMKNNLPVVIMGETGCGKSSLIRNLCGIIGAVLRTLNIHGGKLKSANTLNRTQ